MKYRTLGSTGLEVSVIGVGTWQFGGEWGIDFTQKQLDESLKSLKTDYIDIYQMHSGTDDEFQIDGLWEVLRKQADKGKIRHPGLSISGNDNIFQTLRAKEIGLESIQVVYNRLDRIPEDKILPQCLKDNLGVFARVPLASGLLSGKYKPGHQFIGTNVRASRADRGTQDRLKKVEKIGKEEVPEGVSMASWALAWCLRNSAVTAVIPGCKNPGQVISNASASDILD